MTGKDPYTKLTESPKTVKEAIDWMIRLVRKDSSQKGLYCEDFCTSLKAVLGDGAEIKADYVQKLGAELSKFIGWELNETQSIAGTIRKNGIASKDYKSAYKAEDISDNNANWRTVCKDAKDANKSNGGKCCGYACTGNCPSNEDCPMKGCCEKCPKAICARIFSLIIPVLHNVFEFLKYKLDNTREWSGRINTGELGNFLTACGFQNDQLNNQKTGEEIKTQLGEIVNKLKDIKQKICEALETFSNGVYFLKPNGSQTDPQKSQTPPASLTDMLLWLQFLPYCSEYKKVLTGVNKLLNGRGTQSNGFATKMNDVISSMPMMFLFVEGAGSTTASSNNGISLFQKIGELSKCQHIFKSEYYEPDKAAKILLSTLPILHWSLAKLNEKCGSDTSKTVAYSTDTKDFLKRLGWSDSSTSATGPTIQGSMQCDNFKKYLESTLVGKSKALDSIKDSMETVWKTDSQSNSGPSSPSSNKHEPKTIREMLMWVQCLPSSGMFNGLRKKIKDVHNGQFTEYMQSFGSMIFELPSMYHALEGDFTTLLANLFKHQGIESSSNAFSYGKDDGKCLNLFSAIVATLYMTVRYLQQRCSTKGDWKDLQLDGQNGTPPSGGVDKTELKNFLEQMGFGNITPIDTIMKGSNFNTGVIDKCFGDLTQARPNSKLYTLYQCALEHFNKQPSTVASPPSIAPTTIRQMMLWLIGLPLTKQYNTLTTVSGKLTDTGIQNVIGGSSSITSTSIKENILSSASGLAVTMIVVEASATSILDFLKSSFADGSQGSYSYGKSDDNGTTCFDLLKDFSYKVHCQLRFLHYMTKESRDNGGWKDCEYGNVAKQGSGKCQRCGAITSCLAQFLEGADQNATAGQYSGPDKNQFIGLVTTGNSDNLKDVGMGFLGKMNGNASRTGNDIQRVLSHVCHANEGKPLTLLSEYIITIGQQQPTTLGDYIDLFRQFTCEDKSLWDQRKINGNEKSIEERLTEELKVLKGTEKSGTDHVNELKEVIVKLYPRDHNGNQGPVYDLLSMSCAMSQSNDTCAPYIRPLGYSVWNSYAPKIVTSDPDNNGFHTLQWLYDMCYKLLNELQRLRDEFRKCSCCSVGSCGSNMVECKKALPMLYKQGMTFYTPSSLKSSNKNCQGFIQQLKKVTTVSNPLSKVFEKIIETIYHILLSKARGCVSTKAALLPSEIHNNRQEDKEQWETAFKVYVTDSLEQSRKWFECTFVCKLFGENSCQKHISKPAASSQIPNSIASENVINIEAVIPRYTPPHIDQYHYKTYQKLGVAKSTGHTDQNKHYSITDAINFHIDSSQCITPTPLSLRSVIDWLLRVTVGQADKDQNNNINSLTQALKTVFNTPADVSGVEDHVTSLVSGFRKFVGYENKSNEVFKNIEDEKKSVITEVGKRIEANSRFLTGKDEFATEMGRALLKGKYSKGKNSETIYFEKVINGLQGKLTATHEGCSGVKCTNFNANSADPKVVPTVTAKGLQELYTFFDAFKSFAALWKSIGTGRRGDILQTQKAAAVAEIQYNPASNPNGDYFTKLHEALEKLGECADKVSDLYNNGGGYTKSLDYRNKIDAVITHLRDHVLSCLKDTSDSNGNGKSDPAYAVKAADALIKHTKTRVVTEITKEIKEGVETKYTELAQQYNGQCKAHPGSKHQQFNQYLCAELLVESVTNAISVEIDKYKEHLYDLKALCQWLYRMGQLYNAGLQGFVKSLINHLKHIIDVLKWIEGIEKMVTKLNLITNKGDLINNNIFSGGDIQHCCSSHKMLYDPDKFSKRDDFFTALNCRVDHLLTSYVMHQLPEGNVDRDADKQNVDKCHTFLTDLRLLALDRYTLQVWEDTKGAITDWITLENGIVRHSNLDAIKSKLSDFTNITPSNSRKRIHDFHAICVIQKFSFQEPITRLEGSLKELEGIQKQLQTVKGKCNENDVSSVQKVKDFCDSVSKFLKDPYGIYQFAKFVHTILGPNIFSAVIGAMEHVQSTGELSGKNKPDEVKKTKFYKSVVGLLQGPEKDLKKGTMEEYKLENICKKLESFIATLGSEYIFSYPVVTSAVKQQALAPLALSTTTELNAKRILYRLETVTCGPDAHKTNAICDKCWNVFAYIFLGQVPKLYHSFRFMSWMSETEWTSDASNASITSYLVSMGIEDTKIEKKANQNKLHDTMKSALEGFEQNDPSAGTNTPSHKPKGLKEIHEKLEELLKGLIRNQHEQALQSIAKGGTDTRRRPRTIREMLHWLSGVPFSVVYEGMQQVSTGLCDVTLAVTNNTDSTKDATTNTTDNKKHTINPEWISYRLGVSCAECLDVLQAIEDPLGKEPTKRFKEYIATYDFYYPANASQLFYMFVDVIYYVYVHMKFVYNMTGRDKAEGGWERCEFVSTDASAIEDYNNHKIVCDCPGSYVEYTCSRPLRRLLSSVSTVFTGRSLGFQLPKEKLYSASVVGSVVHNVIKHIFGKDDNYSTLCKFLLAVSTCPPTSIGDMISFLYWYRNKMFVSEGNQKANEDSNVYKSALHHEIELFPGTFEPDKLTNALNDCFNGHAQGQLRQIAHDESNKDNMLSVMDCLGQADESIQAPCTSVNCAPYLRPLAYEVYDTYVPLFSRAYLSWILHFGPRVYAALEELKGKLDVDCKHCTDNNNTNSIVTCNAVLPELYSKGLDFWDPKILNGKKKNKQGGYEKNGTPRKCNSLITQLGEVLKTCNPTEPSSPGAPLHRLIEAIEAFLWSIRLPFSLVQLSLWSVAVLFISYVFVVPLDHFKIKSNLFNRLKYTMHPSLLVSDGQRRLSEVAYFAL